MTTSILNTWAHRMHFSPMLNVYFCSKQFHTLVKIRRPEIFCTPMMDSFRRLDEFENHAVSVLPPSIRDYYVNGAGEGHTLKINREAFRRLRIRPRLLRNVSNRDVSTTVLGQKVSMPLGVSPTGKQRLAHPSAECATAKATESAETVFILSAFSSTRIQEVAKAAPKGIMWMQTMLHSDRDCTLHCVRRAEEAGFKAIVLTIDNAVLPKNKAHILDDIPDLSTAVYEDYFLTKMTAEEMGNVHLQIRKIIDQSLTWEAVEWMTSVTKLPIVVKGVLTSEDALLAVKHGASAILVSNHGARQLDGTPAPIEALPEIVKAVGDKVEVYVDGGVRQGIDVFKALAIGARMVFIGRPMLWGLACGGEEGARAVLEIMRREIDETFALAGCSNVEQISRDKDLVVHESYYSRLL
ncbi:hypothetical protein TSAR_004386 [Trichomalopsis sarcophagae]|uniref:(S)-2-hydroxy-acid oxidase n=1 Tax=Trichomalopsis sarcophagae TaxID=543379 RepID=A0A232FH82_9HYME|nr:hypothetical protein TSAR_004386 [Trichomalopsis sarcophagae]